MASMREVRRFSLDGYLENVLVRKISAVGGCVSNIVDTNLCLSVGS